MDNRWDLDSIDYQINWFTSATITYRKHGSDTIHKMRAKIPLLGYLFMKNRIHNAVINECEKLHNRLKKENNLVAADNYYKSII
jgi:hypothetical protein